MRINSISRLYYTDAITRNIDEVSSLESAYRDYKIEILSYIFIDLQDLECELVAIETKSHLSVSKYEIDLDTSTFTFTSLSQLISFIESLSLDDIA